MHVMNMMRGIAVVSGMVHRRHLQQDGQKHESRAVSRRREERPNAQIAKSNLHSAPTRMFFADELAKSEPKQYASGGDLDVEKRQNCAHRQSPRQNQSDRNEVPHRNWQQRLPNCSGAFLLQAESDRKQPAHPWIDAVVSPEQKQRGPGPQRKMGHE